jgi:integrase
MRGMKMTKHAHHLHADGEGAAGDPVPPLEGSGVGPENPQNSGVDHAKRESGRSLGVTETELGALTQQLLNAGVAESTLRARRTDVADWKAFMSKRGEPALPVGERAIADYVTRLLTIGSCNSATPRPLAVGTVERRIASVSSWSAERGQGRVELAQARRVIRGYRRRVGGERPQRAAPLTVPLLHRVIDQVALDERAGRVARAVRDRALITTAFCLAGRRSEVTSIRIEDVTFVPEGALISIHRRKTRDMPDVVAVPLATDPRVCAVRAIRALLEAMGARSTSGPLFRRVSRSGAFLDGQLQPESLSDVVARLTERAGIEVPPGYRGFSGHSLRRGAVSAMRDAGADVFAISRAGGWSSNSRVLGTYLEDSDQWRSSPLRGLL